MNKLEYRVNDCMQELQMETVKFQKKIDGQDQQMEEIQKKVQLLTKKNNRILELENELEKQASRILTLEKRNKEYDNLKTRVNLLEKHIKRLDARIDTANYSMNYLYYKGLHPDCYEAALNDWYYQRTGKHMDLANPVTYNEKIQWLKLFDNSERKTQLADKYLVRNWVAEKIGDEYLIPILGVWKCFEEINFDSLPNKFVLKTNHGSGWNLIVKNKEELDWLQVKSKFDYWIKRNFAFYGLELQYMNIPRRIIAEEYLEELDQVYDYKFMCFNGEVKFIWVDTDRFTNHKRTLFTTNWIRMDKQIMYPVADYDIPKPENLNRMLEIARILSQGFIHVRVDLYDVNGKMYFGEMTFTPESVTLTTEHKEFEVEMGEWIEIAERKPYPCYSGID